MGLERDALGLTINGSKLGRYLLCVKRLAHLSRLAKRETIAVFVQLSSLLDAAREAVEQSPKPRA